ncbi:MAG: 2TM domain-containing protein [Armatimonadetes bacterium]|nr:2TM domain-containing protein [Armatimonadota bacterium]
MAEENERLASEEDVDEILKLALRRQDGSDTDLRGRLNVAAQELGISDQHLKEAETEYLTNKAETQQFLEFKNRQRRELREHVFAYFIVNALLVAINLFTSGQITWSVWPILGWGVGLAFHAWAALNSDSETFQEEFEQFRRKQDRKKEDRPV